MDENKTSKLRKRTSKSSHHHCYLLRSQDPSHRNKTYIGFTTNPYRRLRQHNGELKHGGANRTKRSGRPWEFVAIIGGFTDDVAGLQFEWAWQHPNKSRHIKKALHASHLASLCKDHSTQIDETDDESNKKIAALITKTAGIIHRRRGVKAKLDILRILMTQCTCFQNQALTIYFRYMQHKQEFMTLCQTHNSFLSNSMECCYIESLSEMPFWKDLDREKRKQKKQTNKSKIAEMKKLSDPQNEEDDLGSCGQENFCALCSKSIAQHENPIKCPECSVTYHICCLATYMLDSSHSPSVRLIPKQGPCPSCNTNIIWSKAIAQRKKWAASKNQPERSSSISHTSDVDVLSILSQENDSLAKSPKTLSNSESIDDENSTVGSINSPTDVSFSVHEKDSRNIQLLDTSIIQIMSDDSLHSNTKSHLDRAHMRIDQELSTQKEFSRLSNNKCRTPVSYKNNVGESQISDTIQNRNSIPSCINIQACQAKHMEIYPDIIVLSDDSMLVKDKIRDNHKTAGDRKKLEMSLSPSSTSSMLSSGDLQFLDASSYKIDQQEINEKTSFDCSSPLEKMTLRHTPTSPYIQQLNTNNFQDDGVYSTSSDSSISFSEYFRRFGKMSKRKPSIAKAKKCLFNPKSSRESCVIDLS